jgi:cellulose synthase/poly-beta-1,6-N-acetylglucosamine synthase-like glycosyltransferase
VSVTSAATVLATIVTIYFVLWNVSQLVMGGAGAWFVWRYNRRRTPRALALVARLASPPLVSVVVPARNEALTIVESVRTLLALEYEPREIVVVNDGSTDDTLSVLQQVFRMVPAPLAFAQPLKTSPVRGVYRSIDEPGLVVLDKQSAGCKADASNAGINAASGTLILQIDADTMLEPDALKRSVLSFVEDPNTVAAGGYVAIANGSRIDAGRVTDAGLPRSWFARFQIVEYMRSFLLFRLGCAAGNAVTVISGAFGLFRRDALLEVGGFSPTAVGEDMELTVRLQQYFRARRRPIRIAFIPVPVCWTQAPEDLPSLRAQRLRWRRGLLQVLWRHWRVIGNPRYGAVGLVVMPLTVLFEGIGPLLEIVGFIVTTVAALVGVLNWSHFVVLLAVSILFGAAVTLLAVLLSDLTAKRYLRGRDLAFLCTAALLENVGYRQLNSWWGCVGTVQAMTGRGGWGRMKRRAFSIARKQ